MEIFFPILLISTSLFIQNNKIRSDPVLIMLYKVLHTSPTSFLKLTL